MARSLRLFVPQLDIFTAQAFVRDRYRRLLDRRGWSALRSEGEFLLNTAKTAGTVAVTRSSDQVVGTATAFDLSDIGRQFKGGVGSPIYTIQAVDIPSQTLTLDRVFGATTLATSTYRVFDAYRDAPPDFLKFIAITDPTMGYRLKWWVTQEQLLRWDPQHNFTGTPYAVIDRRFSSTTGAPQFEIWPYCTTERNLPFFYIQRGADLINDADIPIWPIRSDVIVAGAKADLCRWPGTKELPNLMFGKMDIYRSFEAEFEDMMVDLERQDEEIYTTWLKDSEWSDWPWAPLSASWLQSHAV
jgi:hypothetical protein